MRLSVKTNVASLQAANCLFCLHIGSIAFLFGKRKGPCLCRIELFTPLHKWRISTLKKKKFPAHNTGSPTLPYCNANFACEYQTCTLPWNDSSVSEEQQRRAGA